MFPGGTVDKCVDLPPTPVMFPAMRLTATYDATLSHPPPFALPGSVIGCALRFMVSIQVPHVEYRKRRYALSELCLSERLPNYVAPNLGVDGLRAPSPYTHAHSGAL